MRSLRHSIGSPTELKKTFQGYESLKSNLVEFPVPDLGKTRNSSLDPAVKSLRIKLAEMETILRISRERVRLLEKTVEEMSSELEKLQEINKTLLSEKLDLNSSNVHFFVQDLIVTDIKKQLEEAQEDIEKYRLDSERSKNKYEAVLWENKKIEGSIKRYRKIISNLGSQKLTTSDNASIDDIESTLPSIKKNWGELTKEKRNDKQRVKALPIVEQCIKDMSESLTLPDLLTKTCVAIRQFTACKKISLYIISSALQQVYAQSFKTIQHVQRILLGNVWVHVHTDPSCDVVEPTFSKIEEIASGLRTPEKLVQCIYIQKEPSVVLQCLSPSRGFDSSDEKFIGILMYHLCDCIKVITGGKREKHYKDQLLEIVNVSAGISKARNHQSLANAIDRLLPKFFEFETAGVVFVNEGSQEFYTLAYSSSPDEKYSQDIIKFPITMGLTGEAYKLRNIQIFENVKKKNLYNPEIDNIASASDLNNCLMTCLTGPFNKIYGILQLGNKTGGISQRDIQMVSGFGTILGHIIAGINDISEAMDLTIKMKEHLLNITTGLGVDINELSPDSSAISDQLEIIKYMVRTWSKSKKIKLQNIS